MLRLRRLHRDGVWLMVPLDHGMSMGVVPGLEDPNALLAVLGEAPTCLAAHRGVVSRLGPAARRTGVLLYASASTDLAPDPLDKRTVAGVADALRLGADGVSNHINIGSPTEARQLEHAGALARECLEWGMPLVTMAYPRGPAIRDGDADQVAHAARVAAELGADAVKVPYTGDEASFRAVVRGAGIPVLVAGGPAKGSLDALLATLRQARRAGAAGASVGRHVFQSPDPHAALRAVAEVWA